MENQTPVVDASPLSPRPEEPAPPETPAPVEDGGDTFTPPAEPPRIVRRVKRPPADKRKHRKADAPRKRGKESWVYGTKLKWLSRYREKYLRAVETKQQSALYTMLAKLFVIKYGYYMEDDEDLEFDIPDPPDEAADVVVNDRNLSKEEADKQVVYHRLLRKRIGAWLRDQYSGLVKEDKSAFEELFTGVLDGTPERPQRPQLLHFYSRKFYDERLKEGFQKRFKSLQRRAELAGEKQPSEVSVRQEFTKEMWEEETPGFQQEVRVALEREFQLALKAWEAALATSPTRTAEEFDATLNNGAYYLQPFVDAIAARFGMCVSLLLGGPIGRQGGAVGVQSVHAGKTRGSVALDWTQFDPKGFEEAAASLIAFAKEHFTETECQARAVATTEENIDEADSGSGYTIVPAVANPTSRSAALTNAASDDDAGANTGANGDTTSAAELGGAQDGRGDGAQGHGDGGDGNDGASDGNDVMPMDVDEDLSLQKQIDAMWARRDSSEWTEDLTEAHAALARGKDWGLEWATCVANFFDFEAAHGYSDEGDVATTKARPKAVGVWLREGRQWAGLMDIGEVGGEKMPGTYAHQWWQWWGHLQPEDRVTVDGVTTLVSEVDWSELWKLNGESGLRTVMATLLWWGDRVGDNSSPLDHLAWTQAVGELSATLVELISPEVLKKFGPQTKKQTANGKRPAKETKEASRPKRSRKAPVEEGVKSGRTTRSSAAQASAKTRSGGKKKR